MAFSPKVGGGGEGHGSVWSLPRLTESPQLFERFVYGLALLDRAEGTLYLNRVARELLMPAGRRGGGGPWTCCDLICNRLALFLGGECMAEWALESGMSSELRMDLDDPVRKSAWVTVSRVDDAASQLLFHLRPGRPGDRRRRTLLGGGDEPSRTEGEEGAALRISTLGQFRVESSSGLVDSEWLEQRPGQLLKYLICHRSQLVATDQIADAFWPEAGPDEGRNRLRYFVHVLREKLEPERVPRSQSRFIGARRGGYLLETDRIWIDADEFQREVRAGLAAFVQGLLKPAGAHLDAALRLYKGDFLSDDPYDEWTFDERQHLQELAGRALRAQVGIRIQLGDLDLAADHARHLAELEPFDMDAQRMFMSVCLRRGRRSEALRRYSMLRKRMLSSFGQEPDFDLMEVEASLN